MTATHISQIEDWNRTLFAYCVAQASRCSDQGQTEEVLRWSTFAGRFASRKGWFGELSSRELESLLLSAARSLPTPTASRSAQKRPRWLHVLTEAYATLGHTNLCRRWIEYDTEVIHDVVLLDQKEKVPKNLVEAARAAGGETTVLDCQLPLTERAMRLRELAWSSADVVVLHTHPEDVIATAAFGIKGGPPVLFVNHADHTFWFGCSVADLVVDIRSSGQAWTRQVRGVDRTVVLPLPLVSQKKGGAAVPGLESRRALRARLGIPESATLFLTVGSPAKYLPMQGLDFVKTAVELVNACADSYLLAIGPSNEGQWRQAHKTTGGKIRAVGYTPNSAEYCAAADVYLEGFPIGSLTALLEAGEAGLPCVRAPKECVPPFSSDSPGMDVTAQPADAADYIQKATALAKDSGARKHLGNLLKETIRTNHYGADWMARLARVKSLVPRGHSVYPDFKPGKMDPRTRDWIILSSFSTGRLPTRSSFCLGFFTEAWKRTGVRPLVDPALWSRLGSGHSDISGETRPLRGGFDALSLWWLNRRVKAKGARSRLLAQGSQALAKDQPRLARRAVYHCLVASLCSLGDSDWMKLFVKTHFHWVLSLRAKE